MANTPYPANPEPAPGYYPGPMPPSTSGWAIASFACSLLGLVGIPGLGQILGIVFGHVALAEIRRSGGMLRGRGMALAGLIISYVAVGIGLLLLIVFVVISLAGNN